jgi:methylase of polypeptide subunit release factors
MPDSRDDALLAFGRGLRERGYRFVTITPESHRRVNARPGSDEARSLVDVFGWSRPFRPGLLPADLLDALRAAGELVEDGDQLRSRVRCSSIGDALYLHSAFPTVDPDAVFFGPDTYRFAALLARLAPSARHAVDVGCGSGAGGLTIAGRCRRLTLGDINPRALRFAAVNAALGGIHATVGVSDVLAGVVGEVDLVIANPPYLADPAGRLYRDGGGPLGGWLSVRIVREALARLAPGGRLILYTASAIVAGGDPLHEAVAPLLAARAARWDYRELDPDVFGEELDTPAYAGADRIAVVALDAIVPGDPQGP